MAEEGGHACTMSTLPNPSLGGMRLLRQDAVPGWGWLSTGWPRASRQAGGGPWWAQPWVWERRWEGEGSSWHCRPSLIPSDRGCRWAASAHPRVEWAVPVPAVGIVALGHPSTCRGLSGSQLPVEFGDLQEELLLLQLQGLHL